MYILADMHASNAILKHVQTVSHALLTRRRLLLDAVKHAIKTHHNTANYVDSQHVYTPTDEAITNCCLHQLNFA